MSTFDYSLCRQKLVFVALSPGQLPPATKSASASPRVAGRGSALGDALHHHQPPPYALRMVSLHTQAMRSEGSRQNDGPRALHPSPNEGCPRLRPEWGL